MTQEQLVALNRCVSILRDSGYVERAREIARIIDAELAKLEED